VADVLLALHWIFIGGPMEQSVHLTFVITTACVAGMSMVLSGFVLKLLLDNLDDRRAF
ncbi:MAG: glycosyltransferase family 2 protein, partial [Mesorhizobium sp.]